MNFGGYHAEAGLGGLLTGNAAHGGLSASAGTPYGQVAGAGLGGSLDGKFFLNPQKHFHLHFFLPVPEVITMLLLLLLIN